MFGDIYRGKKILVTGHTGFKGAWLSLWLIEMGAEVIGYSSSVPTELALFDILDLKSKMVDIRGDVADVEALVDVVTKYEPEIVFHLAAQPIVRLSYAEPRSTFESNILGVVNMFEAVRLNTSVKAVINITSDKCYENKEWEFGYREVDRVGGRDPYSASKGCSEIITASYRDSFFNLDDYGKSHDVLISSVRAGNVVGGGDWAVDRLIPDCMRSVNDNKKIIIRNPRATRPWQFVLDPLSGYLMVGARLLQKEVRYAGPWNFGPVSTDALDVESVVQRVVGILNKGEYEVVPDTKLHENTLLRLDISKSNLKLNWKPTYNVEETLEKTISWYKEFYGGNKEMFEYTLQQIKDYVKKAQGQKVLWSLD